MEKLGGHETETNISSAIFKWRNLVIILELHVFHSEMEVPVSEPCNVIRVAI